jgi:hypothetical protein
MPTFGRDITDDSARFLSKIETLKHLSLYGTRISEIGMADLRRALPECEIEF